MIHEHAADAPANRVAVFHGLHEHTVKQIDRQILEHQIEQAPKGCAIVIGVDEIFWKKGHVYMAMVTDLLGRRAIALEEGRRAESLERFFRYLGPEHCQEIEAVAVDRWRPYRKAIGKHCPQALVIFDKFHLIADCNEAVDLVRRRLRRSLDPRGQTWLKHGKWALLKNPDNLSDRQRASFKQIEKHNRPLYRAYLLREAFRDFYRLEPAGARQWNRFCMRCVEDSKAGVGR